MDKCVSCYAINKSNWRTYLKGVVPEEERKFSWFLFGARTYDDYARLYVLKIKKGTQIFSKNCGFTKEVIKDDGIKLIILTDPQNNLNPDDFKQDTEKKVRKYKCDGVCYEQPCEKNAENLPICTEAVLLINPSVLQNTTKSDVVCYSLNHNSKIRKKLPDFPSCDQIKQSLEKHNKCIVTRVLLEYLQEYLRHEDS